MTEAEATALTMLELLNASIAVHRQVTVEKMQSRPDDREWERSCWRECAGNGEADSVYRDQWGNSMRCKQDMIDAGEKIVPRTCPVHGILQRCRPAPPNPRAQPGAVLYPSDLPPLLRKGDWMQTYTGGQFWPLDPRADEVRIEDIAAALSKLCRYGGQCIRFYSVAEHCVHVASRAPEGLKRAALLHDASEAYLCDVVRPIKPYLANYLEIEAKLENVIALKFGLAYPMHPEIKRLDTAILADERDQAMAPPPAPWPQIPGVEPLGVTLRFWTPAQAQYEFTTAFYRYGGK